MKEIELKDIQQFSKIYNSNVNNKNNKNNNKEYMGNTFYKNNDSNNLVNTKKSYKSNYEKRVYPEGFFNQFYANFK